MVSGRDDETRIEAGKALITLREGASTAGSDTRLTFLPSHFVP
jgi:hypothetical protein